MGNTTISSGNYNGIGILNNVINTSTGVYRGLWVSPYITSLGATSYLIDAGTNSTTNGLGTHSSVFSVDINGNIITPNTSTIGHIFYNTADQITNFQRGRIYNTTYEGSPTFTINTEWGGSSSNVLLGLYAGAVGRGITIDRDNGMEYRLANNSGSTFIAHRFYAGNQNTTSGLNGILGILGIVNNSSTANSNSLLISTYLQATGSGSQLLINAGTNTAANGSGKHLQLVN